jgi:MFS family permease
MGSLKTLILLILLSISFNCLAVQNVADSLTIADTNSATITNADVPQYDDTFYEAGLVTMTIFFLIGFCILTAIGVAIATLILLAILALGFFGAFSTSIIYGLYKKSLSKAFRLFMVLSFGFCGAVFSSLVFIFFNEILRWFTFENALLQGAILGLLSGFVAGFIAFQILKSLTKLFIAKLKTKN